MAKRKSPTGATRLDVPEKGTYGWMMRIKRGDTFIQEFYADAQYGGKRAAQQAARARYAELAAQLPPPSTSEGRVTARNTSGTVGVWLSRDSGRRSAENNYYSYVAFWRDKGKDITIRFSCEKYGKRAALEMAKIARENRVKDRAWVEAAYKQKKSAKAAAKKRA